MGYDRLAYPNKITSALLLASKKFNTTSGLKWEAVKIRIKTEKHGDAFEHMIVRKNNFYMSSADGELKKKSGKLQRKNGSANCSMQLSATYKAILLQLNSALVLASMLPEFQKSMLIRAVFDMLGEVGSDQVVRRALEGGPNNALAADRQFVITDLPKINKQYYSPRYNDSPQASSPKAFPLIINPLVPLTSSSSTLFRSNSFSGPSPILTLAASKKASEVVKLVKTSP